MRTAISAVAAILSVASLASAAPAAADTQSASAATEWVITGLSRACNAGDTECTWRFGIQTSATANTACEYKTVAAGGRPASKALAGGPAGTCGIPPGQPGSVDGVFTVTSGWSDQFGADHAFTTLSVVNNGRREIVYPAYTDAQVAGGRVVSPNLSFPVYVLP
jgi:hypothetical protein